MSAKETAAVADVARKLALGNEATLTTANALYAGLDSEHHCLHVFLGTGDLSSTNRMLFVEANLTHAIHRLTGVNSTAQLTAIACWARLCCVEAKTPDQVWRANDASPGESWSAEAARPYGFQTAYDAIVSAFQVRTLYVQCNCYYIH